MRVEFPTRLVSELNSREHWSARARRSAKQKIDTWTVLRVQFVPLKRAYPLTIRITRVSGAKTGKWAFDDDNLAGSCKHVRDAIAYWLKIDDGDPRVKYEYAQDRGPAWAVRIEVL